MGGENETIGKTKRALWVYRKHYKETIQYEQQSTRTSLLDCVCANTRIRVTIHFLSHGLCFTPESGNMGIFCILHIVQISRG